MNKYLAVFILIFLMQAFTVNAQQNWLSCQTRSTPCVITQTEMLELSSSVTNAHAALPSSNTYNNFVCCSLSQGTLTNTCSGSFDVLVRLSAATNAHVQRNDTFSNYPIEACIGSPDKMISCSYSTTTCPSPSIEVMSISSDTNAHAAGPGIYPIKVCCQAIDGDPPPVLLSLTPNPIYVRAATTLETITGSVTNFPVGQNVRLHCGTSTGTDNLCVGGYIPSAGSTAVNTICNINSPSNITWTGNQEYTIFCRAADSILQFSNELTTTVIADNTLPTTSITSSPSFIGISTTVTYTATASDTGGSGMDIIEIYVNDILVRTCSGGPSQCVYTRSTYTGGELINYYSRAYDRSGNMRQSSTGSFRVCDLTEVFATATCTGPGSTCKVGDTIEVSASFNTITACPPDAVKVIQADAISSDGLCRIEASAPPADISGITIGPGVCAFGTCFAEWTISSIPSDCNGKIMSYTWGGLWDGNPGAGAEQFDRIAMTGGFTFFNDRSPTINVSIDATPPIYTSTPITIIATAEDNIDITSVSIYVDNANLGTPNITCNAIGPSNTYFECRFPLAGGNIYSLGTHFYNASVIDSAGQRIFSSQGQFTVLIAPDLTPPSVNISYAPDEIKNNDAVSINVSGSDTNSGIANTSLFTRINGIGGFSRVCYNPSGNCDYVNAWGRGTLVEYFGEAADNADNRAVTPTDSFRVCKFESASVGPVFGNCVNGCKTNDVVWINATFTGACPATSYIRVDMNSTDGSCELLSEGPAEMESVRGTCTNNDDTGTTNCQATWTIPNVPTICLLKNVSVIGINMASIDQNDYYPSGVLFDNPDTVDGYLAFASEDAPHINMTYAPKEVGQYTIINLRSVARDDISGIDNIKIYVDGQLVNTCNDDECTATVGPYPSGTSIQYNATATDNSGYTGVSVVYNLTVCTADLVTYGYPNNCGPNGCEPSENLQIISNLRGACPTNNIVQLDAASTDNSCVLTASGTTTMTGTNSSCTMNGYTTQCSTFWTVPPFIPLVCQGQTIYGQAAGVWNTTWSTQYGVGPGAGSFWFNLSLENLEFPINLTLSKAIANEGDIIDAYVKCYVRRGAETVQCTSTNSQIVDVKIDNVTRSDLIAGALWNSTGSMWMIPIDTDLYSSDLNVTVRYLNIVSNYSYTNYFVNKPPVILNPSLNPPLPAVGQPVTFGADVSDPDYPWPSFGINEVSSCRDINCNTRYCFVNYGSGSQNVAFNCGPYVVQSDDYQYFIVANDTLGARSTLGPYTLLATDKRIVIDITYPDTKTFVPLTDTGKPDFTRGMQINFLVTAKIINITNGDVLLTCDGLIGNCNAYFDIDATSWSSPMIWDNFARAWRGSETSSDLSCEAYHNLNVLVESGTLSGLETDLIYVNCNPKVVVDPIERRLALGQYNVDVFNVTLYNPLDTQTYTMTMRAIQSLDPLPLPWVDFTQCNNPLCSPLGDDQVQLNMPALSSYTLKVYMDNPGASGVFPIIFQADTGTAIYEATGTLQIFAEGLPEFGIIHFIILIFIGTFIFAVYSRKKLLK